VEIKGSWLKRNREKNKEGVKEMNEK